MDQQKRLLLALALSFALVTLWTVFFGPKANPPAASLSLGADAGAVAARPPATAQNPSAAVPPPAPAAPSDQPVVTLHRDFSKVHYTLTNDGAGVIQSELQGPKMREQEHFSAADGFKRAFGAKGTPSPQVDLSLPVPGELPALAVGITGSHAFAPGTRYHVSEDSPRKVVMTAKAADWQVTKTFEWSDGDGEQMTLRVDIHNAGAVAQPGELQLSYARAVDPSTEEKGSFFGGVGNQWKSICRVADKVQRWVPSDKPAPEYTGAVDYFGVDQQYFLAAVLPEVDARDGRCTLNATATSRTALAGFPINVEPGQTLSRTFTVYSGAKDSQHLAAIGSPGPNGMPGTAGVAGARLDTAVDFGFWVVICRVLLFLLKFFYGIVHNWGVAIILLTVVVKVVLLPLTHKQLVSAEAMKKLQPKMEAIKKKWPNDKEQQNRETMKLYQEAKVNPLGGCLPLLVQFPIWAALYTTLRASFEIYREPFISPLWADLTFKDPTYLLPLALGVTMILTQRLQPQPGIDPAQAKLMTYAMPGFFTLLMVSYPAGLSLYIFTNNLLTIAQQYGLKRYIKRREAT